MQQNYFQAFEESKLTVKVQIPPKPISAAACSKQHKCSHMFLCMPHFCIVMQLSLTVISGLQAIKVVSAD